jgi:hypothetical protein
VAWGRLLSAIGRVPIDRTEEPGVCGDWSLKILLGHISFWDQFEVEHIAHRRELGEVDWESANEENARASAGRMYADILAELRGNHERLVSVVRSLPDLDPKLVRELTHDHYVEHGAEIEEWLNDTFT